MIQKSTREKRESERERNELVAKINPLEVIARNLSFISVFNSQLIPSNKFVCRCCAGSKTFHCSGVLLLLWSVCVALECCTGKHVLLKESKRFTFSLVLQR
jgi:hypothetical protein